MKSFPHYKPDWSTQDLREKKNKKIKNPIHQSKRNANSTSCCFICVLKQQRVSVVAPNREETSYLPLSRTHSQTLYINNPARERDIILSPGIRGSSRHKGTRPRPPRPTPIHPSIVRPRAWLAVGCPMRFVLAVSSAAARATSAQLTSSPSQSRRHARQQKCDFLRRYYLSDKMKPQRRPR